MKVIMNSLMLLCFIFLTACASSTVPLTLTATKHLNKDTRGHSLPVIVRIYLLNSDSDFIDATFRELWRNDKSALGTSLLARQEYTISPHTQMKIDLPTSAEAKYIGIVALFRHPSSGHWRIISKKPNFLERLSVELTENRININ